MALDLSEFEALGKLSHRQPCKVGITLDALKRAERPKVDAALRSDNANVRRGALRWLLARDLAVSTAALASHRKGLCTCDG